MAAVPNFADKLEIKLPGVYEKILQDMNLQGIPDKTLRCDSYRKIAVEVENIRNDGLKRELTFLEITNEIIYKLIVKDYFVHKNIKMAIIIGYIFLTMHGVSVNNFSYGGITNRSSIEKIRALTASWQR
jgi:prophage maintenance system killer protein